MYWEAETIFAYSGGNQRVLTNSLSCVVMRHGLGVHRAETSEIKSRGTREDCRMSVKW